MTSLSRPSGFVTYLVLHDSLREIDVAGGSDLVVASVEDRLKGAFQGKE
jgi:hypothetical protein